MSRSILARAVAIVCAAPAAPASIQLISDLGKAVFPRADRYLPVSIVGVDGKGHTFGPRSSIRAARSPSRGRRRASGSAWRGAPLEVRPARATSSGQNGSSRFHVRSTTGAVPGCTPPLVPAGCPCRRLRRPHLGSSSRARGGGSRSTTSVRTERDPRRRRRVRAGVADRLGHHRPARPAGGSPPARSASKAPASTTCPTSRCARCAAATSVRSSRTR